jgi:hypothetical protein
VDENKRRAVVGVGSMKKAEEYSPSETADRFRKILNGAMRKVAPLKDIPKKRKGKSVKTSSSDSSPAT